MLLKTLQALFARDLKKLYAEVELYNDENKIWYTEKRIANSGGNLCLHLCGNLKTYIGAELGKISYARNREQEFSLKNISKAALLKLIEETMAIVEKSLTGLKEEEISQEYPVLVLAEKTSTEYFLVHLAMHLAYHLGQVNYHRRLLDA